MQKNYGKKITVKAFLSKKLTINRYKGHANKLSGKFQQEPYIPLSLTFNMRS